MSSLKARKFLQSAADSPASEVMLLADVVGKAPVKLAQVMKDFLEIVGDPIIAGGFAMAHHGVIRSTVDIDVLAVGSITKVIKEFVRRGYKHESMNLSIGLIDQLTKGNKGVDFLHLNNASFLKSIQKRAVNGIFLNESVRFVSREDLILLKELAVKGRKNKMDAADLENLLSQSYDNSYVETWRKKLKI